MLFTSFGHNDLPENTAICRCLWALKCTHHAYLSNTKKEPIQRVFILNLSSKEPENNLLLLVVPLIISLIASFCNVLLKSVW